MTFIVLIKIRLSILFLCIGIMEMKANCKADTLKPRLILPNEGIQEYDYVAISPDKKLIASYSGSKLKLWEFISGKLISSTKINETFNSIKFSINSKLIFLKGKKLLVVDVQSLKTNFIFEKNTNIVCDFKISPDEKLIAVSYLGGVTNLLDIVTKEIKYEFVRKNVNINEICFSPDSKIIALNYADGNSYLHDIDNWKLIHILNNKTDSIYFSFFNLNTNVFITYSKIKNKVNSINKGKTKYTITRNLWNYKSGALLNSFEFNSKREPIEGDDGKSWGIKTNRNKLLIYDFNNIIVSEIPFKGQYINSIFYNNDRNIAIFIESDELDNAKNPIFKIIGIKIYNSNIIREEFKIIGKFKCKTQINDEELFCYINNNRLFFFNPKSGKEFSTYEGLLLESNVMDISNDGYITTNFDDRSRNYINRWNIYNGKTTLSKNDSPKIRSVNIDIIKYDDFNLYYEKKNFLDYLEKKGYKKVGMDAICKWNDNVYFYLHNTNKIYIVDINQNIIDSILLKSKNYLSGPFEFNFMENLLFGNPKKDLKEIYSITPFKYLYQVEKIENILFNSKSKKLICTHGSKIKIVDFYTGKNDTIIDVHFDRISGLFLTKENKYLISTAADKSLIVWDANTYEKLYTRLQLAEGNWICYDNNFRFDGTKKAIVELYLTCGIEIIELDQLKEELYVPNLVERIMKGETIENKKLSDLDICDLMPKVEPVEDNDSLHFKYKIVPRRGGLGKIEIYINEKGIVQTLSENDLKKKDDHFILSISKKVYQDNGYLVPGEENKILVKAYTKTDKLSSRGSIIVSQDNRPKLPQPNVYAIFVGVDNYKGEGLDLKYASKDASSLSSTFQASSTKFFNNDTTGRVKIYNLCDYECESGLPEKKKIEKVIQEVGTKTKPNDIVFLFFAGHGRAGKGNDKNYYFLTSDASPALVDNNLPSVSISSDELKKWVHIDNMKAQKLVLVFDACQATQIVEAFNEKDYAFRDDIDEKSKKALEMERMNDKAGMYLLTSSSPSQSSYEMNKYGHGLLTYSMLKTLKENTTLTDKDNFLTINKWFDESIKTLEDIARLEKIDQRPDKRSGTDFVIGIIDDEVRKGINLGKEKVKIGRCSFNSGNFVKALEDAIKGKCDAPDSDCLFSLKYEGDDVYFIEGSYSEISNIVNCNIGIKKGNETLLQKEYNQPSQKAVIDLIEFDLNDVLNR